MYSVKTLVNLELPVQNYYFNLAYLALVGITSSASASRKIVKEKTAHREIVHLHFEY